MLLTRLIRLRLPTLISRTSPFPTVEVLFIFPHFNIIFCKHVIKIRHRIWVSRRCLPIPIKDARLIRVKKLWMGYMMPLFYFIEISDLFPILSNGQHFFSLSFNDTIKKFKN